MTRFILFMVCLALTACQAQPSPAPTLPTATEFPRTAIPTPLPTPAPERTPTSITGVNPSDLRGVTLKLWHPLTGEQAIALNTLVEDFNRNNIWGIRAEVSAFHSLTALEEQIELSIQSKTLPGVVLAAPSVLADWRSRKNMLADTAAYVKDSEWGLAPKEQADIPLNLWANEKDINGVPLVRDASVLFYNRSWAKELGFSTPPISTEEFRAQACAAMRASLNDERYDNEGQGGLFLDRQPTALLSWMHAFGANPIRTDSGAINFNTPQITSAFTYLRKLLDSACAWSSLTTPPAQAFSQRRALFFTGWLSDTLQQERLQKIQKSSDSWEFLAIPGEGKTSVTLWQGVDGAILRTAPETQLAGWLLLRWLLLPRSQAVLASAGATLPVRRSALALMTDFGKAHPQWNEIIQRMDTVTAAPTSANWRLAQRILEDAAWQIFQSYVPITRIPSILAEIDSTFEELVNRKP